MYTAIEKYDTNLTYHLGQHVDLINSFEGLGLPQQLIAHLYNGNQFDRSTVG